MTIGLICETWPNGRTVNGCLGDAIRENEQAVGPKLLQNGLLNSDDLVQITLTVWSAQGQTNVRVNREWLERTRWIGVSAPLMHLATMCSTVADHKKHIAAHCTKGALRLVCQKSVL